MAGVEKLEEEIYKIKSPREGPTRLFVGGIHGREARATRPILRRLVDSLPLSTGLSVVVPSITREPTKHVSTLRDAYYLTEEGRRLLSLIDYYRPTIYVELHCYVKKAYGPLTDPNRRAKRGVPPLIELENRVLIGSVSPYLLRRYTFDLCLILEVPCKDKKSWTRALRLLQVIVASSPRSETIERLQVIYPNQIENAVRLMERWRREHLSR